MRFNPSDLTSWLLWAGSGKSQSPTSRSSAARSTQALATMRATMALAQDKRRPSSLAPVLWNRWAKPGTAAGADGRRGGGRAVGCNPSSATSRNSCATFPAGSPRRQILGESGPDRARAPATDRRRRPGRPAAKPRRRCPHRQGGTSPPMTSARASPATTTCASQCAPPRGRASVLGRVCTGRDPGTPMAGHASRPQLERRSAR